MLDPVQIILLIVIVVLTSLLVVLGIQVFAILKDLRITVKKVNNILDHAEAITQDIEGPLSALSSLFGAQAGSVLAVVRLVKSFFGKEEKDKS